MFSFEFDPNKSQRNSEKHGIDFEQAQLLWEDPYLISIRVKTEPELRYLAIGILAQKYWTAVYTERSGRIRLISVRRSRKQEIALYENH